MIGLALRGMLGGFGLDMVPPELGRGVFAGAELLEGAELLGPPPTPPLFAGLLELEAEAAGLPAELLAAVAAVMSDWRPDHQGGLMGLPAELGGELRATLDELIARDQDAGRRVQQNVETAALRIRMYRRDPGGLAGALVRYVRESMPEAPEPEARRVAGHILGAYVAYMARNVPAEGWEAIRSLARGAG